MSTAAKSQAVRSTLPQRLNRRGPTDDSTASSPVSLQLALMTLTLITVIQQLPPLAGYYQLLRSFLYVGFASLVVVSLLSTRRGSGERPLLSHLGWMVAWVATVTAVSALLSERAGADQLTLILVPLGILLVSSRVTLSAARMTRLLASYVGLVLIMATWTILVYSPSWSISGVYAVPHKNQVGPMIGIAAVIVLFALASRRDRPSEHTGAVYLWGGLALLALLVTMMLVRNRAGLLAVFIVSLVILRNRFHGLGAARSILSLFATGWVLLVLLTAGYLAPIGGFIFDSFTANYDITDVGSLSAGRTEGFQEGWHYFLQSPILGELVANEPFVGTPHNYALNVLVRLGLVGALPLIAFHMYLWAIALRGAASRTRMPGIAELASYLLLFSLIVAQFEYTYPFGPGVSQVMIWLILGQVAVGAPSIPEASACGRAL